MRVRLLGTLVVVFAVYGAAAPAFAHHGFTVEFDANKCANMKGTLSGITWENPHAYLQMDVKGADGQTHTWNLEMVTPNALKRTGTTKEDFKSNMGKTINAFACPSKAGDNRGAAGYLALSDGLIRLVGQIQGQKTDADKHF